jgi:hypothetical protein
MVSGLSALTQSVNEPSWLIALVVATRVGSWVVVDIASRLVPCAGGTLGAKIVRILVVVLD